MNILSVEIDNFLIIDHAKIDLHDRGLIRIAGTNDDDSTSNSNGSGKSTLIEAVYWSLFGDTLRSLKSADDVVNSNVGANCSVATMLEDSGKQIKVVRYRKHSKQKNNLYLYIDDVDSRGKDNRETQEFIEALIGVDKITFASSIVFGQGYSKNLRRFSELTDKEQKECLEKILELEVFQDAHADTKIAITNKNNELLAVDMKLEAFSLRLDRLLISIDEDIESRNDFSGDIAAKIDIAGGTLVSLGETIAEYEHNIGEYDLADLEDAGIRLESLRELKADVVVKKSNLQTKYFEKKTKLITIKNGVSKDIHIFLDRKDKLCKPSSDGEDCWYCGGMIIKKKILEKSDGLDFEIQDREKTLSQLEDGLSKLEIGYTKRKEKLAKESLAIEELISDVEAEIADVSVQQRELAVLETKLSALVEKKQVIEDSIAELECRVNPWDKILAKKKAEVETVESAVAEKKVSVAAYKEDLQYLEFWKKGFSRQGIRSFMLDRVIPFLNERVNKYLGILTDGGIQVEFNAVKKLASGEYRENFHVAVTNTRAAQTYEGNSGGEKRRIDLAVSLAINDLIAGRAGKRFNILLLDEVFENIDETGTYYVVKVLEELARSRSSVFVITHQDSLSDYFHNEIEVHRLDGKSTIRELSEGGN
mgnify:CR=1 FL=1